MNAQQFQKINAQISTLTKGWLISAIGALVALLSMIMPWAVVNMGQYLSGFTISASGFSIMGVNGGTTIVQLLNLAALVTVIVFFVMYYQRRQLDKVGTIVVMAAGGLSVLLSIVVYAIAAGAAGGGGLNMGMVLAPGLGFFIGLAGFIAVAVGGFLNFQEFRKLHPEAFAPRPAYPYGYPPQQGQYPQYPQQGQVQQQYPQQQQYPPQPPQGQYPQYPQYPPQQQPPQQPPQQPKP